MNKITQIIIVAVVVGVVGFYGGMQYGKSSAASATPGSGRGNFQGFGGQGGGMMRTRGMNGGFTGGSILSKDDKSITLKLRDGGSKIIFFSAATKVMKSTAGATGDLAVGGDVTVMGTTNSDGSITADSIQIRPSLQ